ncbi:MAG: universal stress protein [Nitrosopumilales archaeon]|nr:universal stress protein [Nitrosopumilales archaeon]
MRKILVAIGDEKSLDKCMNIAIPIASAFDASITGVHVVPPLPRSFVLLLRQPWRKNARKIAEQYLEKAQKLCEDKNIQFEKKILNGLPREEIVNYAKNNYDLIVIGRADWGSRLLGSVSSGVVHGAKTSILLVN